MPLLGRSPVQRYLLTDLERQIAAMRNDTTAATVAKRKQLEEQLAEAKKELEKEQYEHSITEQENALNKEWQFHLPVPVNYTPHIQHLSGSR